MNDVWWWLGLGGVAVFAVMSWWFPEWLMWKREQARQARVDRKWEELPHHELECPECSVTWCTDCFGPEFPHDPACPRTQPPIRR